jgi:hypothetical protein
MQVGYPALAELCNSFTTVSWILLQQASEKLVVVIFAAALLHLVIPSTNGCIW